MPGTSLGDSPPLTGSGKETDLEQVRLDHILQGAGVVTKIIE